MSAKEDSEEVQKAMLVMDQCINTPGAMLKMLDHGDALQAFASLMRDKRYPEARKKILSIGHEESDLALIEKTAATIVAHGGHPIDFGN
jgi:K+/H+ antiporter YhaU regulatory subunit KhtT